MGWYLNAFKNFVNFKGRARRKEYWMFALFNYIITLVLNILDSVLGLQFMGDGQVAMGILSSIYSLIIFIPSFSLLFRRIHDLDKSAGWIFISLIPVVGWIWLFILVVTAGTAGDNRYGPDPKLYS